MVLHSGDPHSWNNSLAHATFDDNVDRVGRDTALQLLREDIRSWIKERRGENHQWSLYVRDGEMVTQTGVSLQEMTHNITDGPHSDLVPESIKATAPLEAATLAEATRLAVAGADRIILPEQHLNKQGEVIARYLSVWTKDASDPTLYRGSRIDLGKNTRIEDVRTGTSFAAFQDGQALSFHEHREQKHAFVLAVKNTPTHSFERVEKSVITTIHRSHQETYSHDHRDDASLKDERLVRLEAQQARHEVFDKTKNLDTDLFIHVPRAVVRETAETVRGVAVFLRDKGKREEVKDRIRRVLAGGKKSIDNNNAAAFSLSMGQKDERLTIEKIREKPVRIVTAIETRHAQMRKSAAALVVAAETKVAVGAAPLILASLAQEQPKDFRAVEKSIKRHRKKEVRMKKNELRKAKREMKRKPMVEVVDNIKEQKERRKERRKRKKVYMRHPAGIRIYTFKFNEQRKRRENGGNKIAVAEVLPPLISQKREKRERRRIKRLRRVMSRAERVLEAKLVPKKERKLWVALAVAAAEFRGTARPHCATAQCRQRSERRGAWRGKPMNGEMKQWNNEAVHIDRAIAGVGFGWVLWMLLMRKHNETPKNNFKRSHPASQGGTLRSQEDTPWILLSIIWYLTMLREQGMQTNQTNPTPAKQDPAPQDNTTSNQITYPQQTIPQYAVIYAFAS